MAADTDRRTRRRFARLGAFILSAAIAVFLLRQLQSDDNSRGPRGTADDGDRPRSDPPQGELATAVDRLLRSTPDGAGSPPARPEAGAITGLVIDGSAGRPIPEAQVYWCRPDEIYGPAGPGWTSVTTDEAGRFRLAVPVGEVPDSLVAIAVKNGYGAGKVPVPTNPIPSQPVTITLTQGVRRRGTVRTSAGLSVAGAEVVFAGTHARTVNGRVGSRLGDRALDGSVCLARSNDAGRFEVGGLTPEDVYLVQAEKDGFVVPPGATQYVECRAESDEALDFVLDPTVGAWLQCQDRRTGAPVSTWGGVSVSGAPSGGREVNPWYPPGDPMAWSGEHPWHPGEFRVVYSVPDPKLLDRNTAAVSVQIAKPGFEVLTASIPLRLVTEWQDARPTVVTLTRHPTSGFGAIRLRIREFPGPERPRFIPLVLRAGEATLVQSATWNVTELFYESPLVPAGEYALADFEGAGLVRVDRDGLADVTVSFPRISTASLQLVLVDEARRPLTYASVSVVTEDRRVVTSLESRMAFRDGPQEIKNLEPGRYEVAVHKPGFLQTTRTIDVVAGSRSEVEIVLRRN